jgi:hypothetical protein
MTLNPHMHTLTVITREEGPKWMQFVSFEAAELAFNSERKKDENVAVFLHNRQGELERTDAPNV